MSTTTPANADLRQVLDIADQIGLDPASRKRIVLIQACFKRLSWTLPRAKRAVDRVAGLGRLSVLRRDLDAARGALAAIREAMGCPPSQDPVEEGRDIQRVRGHELLRPPGAAAPGRQPAEDTRLLKKLCRKTLHALRLADGPR